MLRDALTCVRQLAPSILLAKQELGQRGGAIRVGVERLHDGRWACAKMETECAVLNADSVCFSRLTGG